MAADYVARGISGDEIADELAAQREVIGPCPTPGCGGEIVENSKAFGCTSWKSRSEPGCGFVIWKKVRGQPEVTAEAAREMLASGRTNATPAASKEPIGACPTPGCGGQIVENSRAFGCTSWKSRKEPGCGFVIWKRQRGAAGEVSREAAAEMLRTGTLPVTAAAQRAPKEPIGDCPTPGCGGQIVENSRAFGCTLVEVAQEPGLRLRDLEAAQRGLDREIGREEAAEPRRPGLSEPAA